MRTYADVRVIQEILGHARPRTTAYLSREPVSGDENS